MAQRLYTVRRKQDGAVHLIKADTRAQALRHISEQDYEVGIPSGIEIAEMVAAGASPIEIKKAEETPQ